MSDGTTRGERPPRLPDADPRSGWDYRLERLPGPRVRFASGYRRYVLGTSGAELVTAT